MKPRLGTLFFCNLVFVSGLMGLFAADPSAPLTPSPSPSPSPSSPTITPVPTTPDLSRSIKPDSPVTRSKRRENSIVIYENIDIPATKVSALAGDLESQVLLAQAYQKGTKSLKKDDLEAYKWAFIAHSRGHEASRHQLRELELFLPLTSIQAARKQAELMLPQWNEQKK